MSANDLQYGGRRNHHHSAPDIAPVVHCWSDILALFDYFGAHDKSALPISGWRTARNLTKQKLADTTWWTSEQACRHYQITRHYLYMVISRFKIPRKSVRRHSTLSHTSLFGFLRVCRTCRRPWYLDLRGALELYQETPLSKYRSTVAGSLCGTWMRTNSWQSKHSRTDWP